MTNHPNIKLKTCPSCGQNVVTLIMDNATRERTCHYRHDDKDSHAVRLGRKFQNLFESGRLNEVDYPLAERIRNLNGDWEPVN